MTNLSMHLHSQKLKRGNSSPHLPLPPLPFTHSSANWIPHGVRIYFILFYLSFQQLLRPFVAHQTIKYELYCSLQRLEQRATFLLGWLTTTCVSQFVDTVYIIYLLVENHAHVKIITQTSYWAQGSRAYQHFSTNWRTILIFLDVHVFAGVRGLFNLINTQFHSICFAF